MIVPVCRMGGPASQTHFGCIVWQLSYFDESDHFLELSALAVDFIFAQRDEYLAGPLDANAEAEPFEAARRWHNTALSRVQL